MKKQDFERLKAICEKEGFEISYDHKECDTFNISVKKDPWDDVKFIKFISLKDSTRYRYGKIYPFTGVSKYGYFTTLYDEEGNTDNGLLENYIVPSTEEAYVDQLMDEVVERFVLIKNGDTFLINGSCGVVPSHCGRSYHFDYDKKTDSLFYKGVLIYQNGKWAERVNGRVDVYVGEHYMNPSEYYFRVNLKNAEEKYSRKNEIEITKFLASQLEKYLNNEI